MGRKGLLLLLLLFTIILLVLPQPITLGLEVVTVEGTVKDHSTGSPIPHANILVLRRERVRWEKVSQGEVDSSGYFHFELRRGEYYTIYAYYDDPLTPGFDYVPARMYINYPLSENLNITFELWEGASMFLEGEAYFVETAETPQTTYSVLYPDSEVTIEYSGYCFSYSEGSSHYQLPGINPNYIIVPANTPFRVKVVAQSLGYSFIIDKPGHFLLGKGEVVHIDLKEYALPSCLSVVRAGASEIDHILDEKESEGFYLAVERQRFAQINSLILEAENLLGQGAYETSFSRLRYAYTEISNLRNWLNSMGREALISVFLLIPFLAFTATTTSYLLFEEKIKKFGGASALYALLLPALYLLYPGSQIVEVSIFLGASLLSFIALLALANILPRVLKGRKVRGRVPLRNLIVPVFSIAKRSLRRRRLRSIFTFITVMVLVSSFIALTSFTTGFGLTFNKVSSQPGPPSRILVRALKTPTVSSEIEESYAKTTYQVGPYPWDVYWFPPLDNSSIKWFEERSEAVLVAPKMENIPAGRPWGYLGGYPIEGIIGVVPSAEAEVLPWNETIVEGRFLSDGDENGVLISKSLQERMNVTVGESLTFDLAVQGPLRLEVVGVFDDTRFMELRDLDGRSLIPWKFKSGLVTAPGGAVTYLKTELFPCSTGEILVITCKTASELYGMYLSRLNVVYEGVEDMVEYAKMLTLNKGFRVWASTEDGLYLAQLSSYYEGKGLPITVPWGIVVLNVVVTMLNSLYERRREINIYSAIGMNPSHISGAFLAEVAMIGVLGGGIGYLVGLGWYKVMSVLALSLQVKQKVSALWVLAAIAVAIAAVLTGGLAAIKGSVVITPSLMRRWSEGKKLISLGEPLELDLPVRVPEVEEDGFIGYVVKRLRSHRHDIDYVTSFIRESREETEDASLRTIEFFYHPAAPATATMVHTTNKIISRKEKGSEAYTVKLLTQGHPKGIQRIASLIRKTVIEWSIERGKL